ncbi:unnamed protein product [Coregonus sp. 'balchen']|nr:unnamed protein product [Coregonus sp. 'balchen']
MSQFSTEDEAELRQNLRYEFVKYLRQYVESALGAVIEEETESCARGEGHAVLSGQNTLVHAVTRRTRESGEYDKVLCFFAKTFSSSPLNLTREIDTSLVISTCKVHGGDNRGSLHPEHGLGTQGSEKALYFIALLDIKATWFKKWMHGYYSRTVVYRLLERKYKSLQFISSVSIESCDPFIDETAEALLKGLYTAKKLEYTYFVHSLCVLGRLLMYTNGRKLFPIKVGKRKGQINLPRNYTHIADTLARIATTERGLSLFLYERNLVSAKSEGMRWIMYSIRLFDLAKELPLLQEADTSPGVSRAFIFVCRQMYNTWEGLQVLRPYGLYECIAAAWEKTSSLSESDPTPVPRAILGTSSQELQNIVVWEETLLDNLLNFSATPKGLLFLQQTGAINECVTYMFSRFTKKRQVSRCEKFGYSVMVTQVAATAPGVVALHSSVWERGCEGRSPQVHSHGLHKQELSEGQLSSQFSTVLCASTSMSFLSLVNLLSSPHAQPLPKKAEYNLREMPTSITI